MPLKLSRMMIFAAAALVFGTAAVSAQTVTGSIANGSVSRGKAARGSIVLSIPGGLHVNSSRPSAEYMIPTTVKVSAKAGVKVTAVTYPKGVDRKFQFSEQTINIYEGRVTFPFTVTVGDAFKGGEVVVNVSVNYQACTDEVCYSPKTKTITLKARVN